ncbi:GNAT family N-acetyltransferase [Leptospira sarikeiensis]|uniref:GNAT family N-acetyltransferase n=1 Tax=Leptospira sarikeiensis TaxID=2484943 RepID=A0A4R9KBS0_9LEPT|nr:GNAT family N-acetyltransferase [Leptospira sarikeiensis]TGL64218.1 GNAT family N-acetyltransferase [Leptospira sarikeiensis]
MDPKIRKLSSNETPPMDLLLLADPNESIVRAYWDRAECYILESEKSEVLGVYVLLKTRPGTYEIINVAVKETEQGKGFGKKLVLHAISQAKENGIHSLEIGTGNAGIGQLSLYQKCGFRITGIDFDFFTKNYPEPIYENGILCRDMIRMSLDL